MNIFVSSVFFKITATHCARAVLKKTLRSQISLYQHRSEKLERVGPARHWSPARSAGRPAAAAAAAATRTRRPPTRSVQMASDTPRESSGRPLHAPLVFRERLTGGPQRRPRGNIQRADTALRRRRRHVDGATGRPAGRRPRQRCRRGLPAARHEGVAQSRLRHHAMLLLHGSWSAFFISRLVRRRDAIIQRRRVPPPAVVSSAACQHHTRRQRRRQWRRLDRSLCHFSAGPRPGRPAYRPTGGGDPRDRRSTAYRINGSSIVNNILIFQQNPACIFRQSEKHTGNDQNSKHIASLSTVHNTSLSYVAVNRWRSS